MNSWTITNLDLKPHSPEILASTDDARAIALMIPAGESFDDHQVHERAWVTVIDGEVEITTSGGESVTGSTGLVVAFAPKQTSRQPSRTSHLRVGERCESCVGPGLRGLFSFRPAHASRRVQTRVSECAGAASRCSRPVWRPH